MAAKAAMMMQARITVLYFDPATILTTAVARFRKRDLSPLRMIFGQTV
jgi:hypothetical protein